MYRASRRLLCVALLTLVAQLPGAPTAAATSLAFCNIFTLQQVSFGTYDPLDPSPLDAAGALMVSCAGGDQDVPPPAYIKLGTGTGGSFLPRQMSSGGNTLEYNLYKDAAHTVIWGDGTSSTSFWTIPTTGAVFLNMYGRIPTGSNAAPGVYSDTVLATVEF